MLVFIIEKIIHYNNKQWVISIAKALELWFKLLHFEGKKIIIQLNKFSQSNYWHVIEVNIYNFLRVILESFTLLFFFFGNNKILLCKNLLIILSSFVILDKSFHINIVNQQELNGKKVVFCREQ